ncbi:hypothetical protein HZA85_04215 [Candidatus Uhrbacteria bacterium]|nr:hypothetical protein [Candidatus Uhrbacteria bacterium]
MTVSYDCDHDLSCLRANGLIAVVPSGRIDRDRFVPADTGLVVVFSKRTCYTFIIEIQGGMLSTVFIDAGQATRVFAQINWLQPSWDLFIVLFFIIASLLYGISLGRDRIIVILVSIYMALAIVNYIPFISAFTADISVNDAFALRISVFLGIFILLFFFLSHSALLRTLGHAAAQGPLWQVMIFSFLHVGLLISVTLSFFPASLSSVLSPLTQAFFTSDIARAAWVSLPVLAMVVIGRGYDD